MRPRNLHARAGPDTRKNLRNCNGRKWDNRSRHLPLTGFRCLNARPFFRLAGAGVIGFPCARLPPTLNFVGFLVPTKPNEKTRTIFAPSIEIGWDNSHGALTRNSISNPAAIPLPQCSGGIFRLEKLRPRSHTPADLLLLLKSSLDPPGSSSFKSL